MWAEGEGCVLLGVKDTVFLEDLGDDGDGRVDWVRDDEDEGFGCCGGDTCGEIADDASVDLIFGDRGYME